jgi:hypothetical protein
MRTEMEIHNQAVMDLVETIPEKAELEVLQHYFDVTMLEGVKLIDRVFRDGDEETHTKIKAFKEMTQFGRYLETRKLNNRYIPKEEETENLLEIMNGQSDPQ